MKQSLILKLTFALAVIAAGALLAQTNRNPGGGRLTGTVTGLDEEAKIVHMIEHGRTFDYRVWVAFQYAMDEIAKRRQPEDFYKNPENVRLMNASVVVELRRAMLCQDAPEWAKAMRADTVWWSTNVLNPGQYPWHWEPDTGTNGPGIDWSKVPERDIP